jgi:hypothetical protein
MSGASETFRTHFNNAPPLERIPFFRDFVKLEKASINFAISVSLSICVDQLGCYLKDFHDFDI